MRTEWVRVLLPGQRLVQDATDGQWYIEYGLILTEPDDFPFPLMPYR